MKKILAITFGVIVIITLLFWKKEEKGVQSVCIDKNGIEVITFLDITPKGEVILTDNDRSYKITAEKKEELEFKIVGQFDKRGKREFYIEDKINRYGIVNEDLKVILSPSYNYVSNISFSDYFLAKDNEENYFLIDTKNEKVGVSYEYAQVLEKEKLIKVKSNGKYGLLDGKGKLILPLEYDDIYIVKNGRALVKNSGKYGLIDIKEGVILPIEYDEVYFSEKNYLAKKDGNYYLNNKLVEGIRVYPSFNDVLIYEKENGFALINLEKLEISEKVLSEVSSNFNNYLIVGNGDKYSIINKNASLDDLDYRYDYVEKLCSDTFQIGDNSGLLGLVVGDKLVTEIKYDKFIILNCDYYLGVLGKNEGELLNSKGEVLDKFNVKDLFYYNENIVAITAGEKLKLLELEE